MDIESLSNDLQKCVFWWLPYIDLNRYRRVSKRWKENTDSVLQIYPSAWIINGLITVSHTALSYSNDGIHRWMSYFVTTPLFSSEFKRIFPKKSDTPAIMQLIRTDPPNNEQFMRRLFKLQAMQFVRERIRMYNIIFGTDLDPSKPIFHERLSKVIILPIKGEFHIRMTIQKEYSNGSFSMACFPLAKLQESEGDEVTQGNMVWCGINKGLTIEDFEKNNEYIRFRSIGGQLEEYTHNTNWMEDASRGFYDNQHILEAIVYRTQRVFNALEVDWQNFIYTPVNLEKLRLQHEVYCRLHPEELEEK